MAKKLEDWLAEVNRPVPSNYVGEEYIPAPIKEDPSKAEAYKQMVEEDKRQNLASKDGTLTVSAAEVEQPVVEKPSVKETIKKAMAPEASVPQYNPQHRSSAPSVKESVSMKMPIVPQVEGPSVWERAMVGATPLLVGLLTGNKMEGAQVAANHLVKDEGDLVKRGRDLNSKLAELAMKRELAGEGGKRRYTSQTIAVEDNASPGGVANIKATFDTFTGKYFTPDGAEIPSNFIRSGYSVNPEEYDRRKMVASKVKRSDADYLGTGTRIDPTTGQLGIVRNGVISPVEGQETGKLNVRQQEERNKLAGEFRQNPIVKRVMPVLSTSQSLQSLLTSGKPVSQKAAQTLLARMSGEVGNLNMMEQQLYMGSPSLNESAKRWLNLQATDKPLQPHEVEELIAIATHYTASSKQMLDSAVQETRRVGIEDLNLPEDTVNRVTSPIAAPLNEQVKKAEEKSKVTHVNWKGKTYESENPEEKLAVEINGKFFWTSADWEDVKKEHPKAKRLN